MRRASFVIALLLVACDGAETETPNNQADKAKAKAEPEVEAKPEAAQPEADKPPPGVKVHGNLPIRTESELAAEGEARNKCVADCVEARRSEAKGADALESECQAKCMSEMPIEQVEVVPDSPMPQ